jgi:hypothetical protein
MVRVVYCGIVSRAVFRHLAATDEDTVQAIKESDEIVEMAHLTA